MKAIIKIIVGLLVVVVLAVWLLASNIDGIVKGVIESVGSETLATRVSLGSVEVKLGEESGAALRDLSIANPDGYTQPYAFELGTVGATIAPASLSTDTVVIPRVLIEDAKLTFEQQGNSNNLQTLLDNMDTGSTDGSAGGESSAEGEADVLLAIGELRLAGVGVTAYSDELEQPFEFVLKDVVVRDVGTPEKGVTPDAAAELIMEPVIDAALEEASAQVKQAIEAAVKQEIDKKKEEAKEDLKDDLRRKLRGD